MPLPLLAALAPIALAQDGPDIVLGGGLGVFAPLRRPWQIGPTLDGQVDVTGFFDEVPELGASANVQIGLWPGWACPDCPVEGVWRVGVGPMYATEHVDVALFARISGFGGGRPDLRPAVQVTGKIPVAEPLEVRPFLGIEGVRFVDLVLGARVAVNPGDSTGTRARQCEEGDTRTMDEPIQDVGFTWIGPLSGSSIELDYGDAYVTDELKNPLGEMKTLLGDVLAISSAAQSAKALGKGEAGVGDYAGRMQDLGGKYGLDWTVPLSPADLPGALASNYLEIGRRAIDALLPKLDAHRKQFLFGATITYQYHHAAYECVPTQVCVDGWWQDGGWTPRGEPTVTPSGTYEVVLKAPDASTPRGRVLAMWRKIGTWYRTRRPENRDVFEQADDICAIGNGFDTQLDVGDGPSREDCEQWLRQRAGLQSERRALVGSSMELHKEQLDFASEQTRLDCEDARARTEFWESSAAKRKEIADIAGDAQSRAHHQDAVDRADEARAAAERDCGWAKEVERAGERLGRAIEDAPGRIEAIDAELAELEAKIGTCDLLD